VVRVISVEVGTQPQSGQAEQLRGDVDCGHADICFRRVGRPSWEQQALAPEDYVGVVVALKSLADGD
jgi:DNA-binding transcriptional LysR family regulator